MSSDSAKLFVHIQVALQLSQKDLGALIGRTKRTIQRWQSKGTSMLTGEEARILADHLGTAHGDLAEQVLALGARHGALLGQTATPQVLEAILGAAALEGDMAPRAVRPLVAAAFEKAAEEGVSVQAVVAALRSGG
jgi:hypothetical protein